MINIDSIKNRFNVKDGKEILVLRDIPSLKIKVLLIKGSVFAVDYNLANLLLNMREEQ